jgi:hypothetical protein
MIGKCTSDSDVPATQPGRFCSQEGQWCPWLLKVNIDEVHINSTPFTNSWYCFPGNERNGTLGWFLFLFPAYALVNFRPHNIEGCSEFIASHVGGKLQCFPTKDSCLLLLQWFIAKHIFKTLFSPGPMWYFSEKSHSTVTSSWQTLYRWSYFFAIYRVSGQLTNKFV